MNGLLLYRSTNMLLSLLCVAALSACGGGAAPDDGAGDARTPVQLSLTPLGIATSAATAAAAAAAAAAATPVVVGRQVTDVSFTSTSTAAQSNVPVTFGQVFADGDMGATDALAGKLADGSIVPLQLDVKASYADKSVRHAVITAILPSLAAGQAMTMGLVKTSASARGAAPTPAQLLAAGFSTDVSLTIGGQLYTVSVQDLLKASTGTPWLAGGLANEWTLSAPLHNAAGQVHPLLSARFDVRAYAGAKQAKVDVVIENDWAFQAGPQNVVYDAQIKVGGQVAYSKLALTHYRQARWKKTLWWGAAPQVAIKHNIAYLIASKAVANYDQSAIPSSATLAQLRLAFSGAVTEPMQRGLATAYMPQTGGRPDLGLLPGWAVTYLLSMDKDAKAAMTGTADLAGSWSSHYRDQKTGRVVSLVDYPYMTILGHAGDTVNPATKKSEAFPACGGDCSTPLTADSAHEPNFAYLPYLVTGDHYYLEELQFWAMFNILQANPGYRNAAQGLIKWDQIRGQAWTLRSLSEAAAITPDADPLKAQFTTFLTNNLNWYNATYSNNSAPNNALGAITDANALVYNNGRGLAPWQDDFFTVATGHAAELGFAPANALLHWKSTFPVQRMLAAGYCWIDASIYEMMVRDSATSANYTDMAHVYQASETPAVSSLACGSAAMATAMNLKVGEMVGYANSIDGYPAYFQGALAYSVNAGNADAARAWALYQSRSIKPDYTMGAQFDILPR